MRYVVEGIPPLGAPPGRAGHGAFLPGLPVTPKALKWGFWGAPSQLNGAPGTDAIAAPIPTFPRGQVKRAAGGIFSSHDAPPAIYPSLYYVQGYQEHAPVSLFRSNNIPVPAADVYAPYSPLAPFVQPQGTGGTQTPRLAQIAMRSWRIGGAEQTGQPPAVVSWPWGNRKRRGDK